MERLAQAGAAVVLTGRGREALKGVEEQLAETGDKRWVCRRILPA
ncbi:MAG TPA: hypothetical protein VGN76_04730 [Gemmatimonadales bacterium]|nr:hypothetical protein [Gemmatimonadales bacterium]